jgi:hypothetical protein
MANRIAWAYASDDRRLEDRLVQASAGFNVCRLHFFHALYFGPDCTSGRSVSCDGTVREQRRIRGAYTFFDCGHPGYILDASSLFNVLPPI